MAYNLTPSGGNADLAGKTVITLDGYEVTYDSNGFARQSVSPNGETKFYDALGNQTSVPPDIRVSPANDPEVPVLPVSTEMPITDTIPATSFVGSAPAGDTTPGFVYDSNGELIPADSVSDLGQESLASLNDGPADIPVDTNDQGQLVDLNTGEVYGIDPNSDFLQSEGGLNILPEEIDSNTDPTVPDGGLTEFTSEGSIIRQPEEVSETALYGTPYDDEGNLNPGWELDGDGNPYYKGYSQGSLWINPNTAASAEASRIEAQVRNAQQQQSVATQRAQLQDNDWRVRLQLAPGATYLYNDPQPGILQPLKVTDGIIFPYTPKIDLTYKANYATMDLTHSNYRGYFYQNSMVESINITANFTAQDTNQANYLLAVIHFFRSVTKMFYGQDAQRGSPPPLVYLSGFGQYQFNSHPCVVSSFNYNLPDDVDYIRAQVSNQVGLNLTSVNNNKQSVATNNIFASISRLAAAFTTKGALPNRPFGSLNTPNLANGNPTYVPTKMAITITLLPMQSRQQISQQFSLKNFANGNQLKGGFW